METALYEEKQKFAARNLIIVIAVVVAFIGLWLGQTATLAAVLTTAFALAAAGAVLWGFSSLNVRITPSELRFGFPFFTKRVAHANLRVGEIATIPFWYGMGIHFVRGTWVWNARLGRGVRIDVGRTKYLIGSDHPEQLQAVLMERAGQRVKV